MLSTILDIVLVSHPRGRIAELGIQPQLGIFPFRRIGSGSGCNYHPDLDGQDLIATCDGK